MLPVLVITTGEISRLVEGRLQGPDDIVIRGVNMLQEAGANDITFVGDAEYARAWPSSRASAVLVSEGLDVPHDNPDKALIRVPKADVAMARMLGLFAPPVPSVPAGVHPTACVDPSASLASTAAVGPHCVIGPRVTIGDDTVLHGQVTVLDDSNIGAACVLWPGTIVRERCRIGDRTILHPHTVIGADGFGYRPAPDGKGLIKIPQIGTVDIGEDVEIGAGTCIDRGKFSATKIGRGTKIDNLCQIAHGCLIGSGCIIAGQCGIAGSVTIGDGVVLGGKVGVKDHVTIGAGTMIAGGASVLRDVPAGRTWGGNPAKEHRDSLREMSAVRRLPAFLKAYRGSPQGK